MAEKKGVIGVVGMEEEGANEQMMLSRCGRLRRRAKKKPRTLGATAPPALGSKTRAISWPFHLSARWRVRAGWPGVKSQARQCKKRLIFS
jgi:hypothetical protein